MGGSAKRSTLLANQKRSQHSCDDREEPTKEDQHADHCKHFPQPFAIDRR
jgi:hypothetical protein